MSTVYNDSVIDLDTLKTFLKITGNSMDTILNIYLKAAKKIADYIVNQEFLDEDENDIDIPENVELWVLQFCAKCHENPILATKAIEEYQQGRIEFDEENNYFGLLLMDRSNPGF